MSSRQVPLQHRLAGAFRFGRAALLGATALQAAGAAVLSAAAQPAQNARPAGGVVAAGSASIGFAGNTTAITQSSPRAAIDWQSFNVGSSQRVTFSQPSSSAVTLNTVTGADPSQIAGRIDANGQIIIANRSGVMFHQGAEVNAQSLVVSAAGISRQNFMAGKLVLDQAPLPGARVVNQGSITVKQAGLAALVAPEVANSGVITAKFGHVVLAGAEAATLDLYGDGLVSVDVTRAVHAVRTAGGQTATALVTNTGAIVADGGTVQLTAAAADGIVTNLVDARGTIRANTVNGHTGTIAINGTGGSILIEGSVAAEGKSAGGTGGAIEINSDHTVTLGGTARVSASGRAGGGVIAVGTTLARAAGGPSVTPAMTARQTRISKGATITADAGTNGNGGRITVLSTERTDFAGTITARGGASSGDGGTVEISSGQGLGLTGNVDVCAPHGACGDILLDPANLTIVTGGTSTLVHGGDPNLAFTDGGTLTDASISPNILLQFAGNIHLQATDNITVAANVTLGGTPGAAPSLELEAGGNVTVNPGFTVSVVGNITFIAGSTLAPGGGNAAAGIFLGAGSSISAPNGLLSLTSGTGGISFGGDINTFGVQINSTGAVTQPGGVITSAAFSGQSSSLTLGQPNRISQFGTYSTTSGGLALTEAPGQTADLFGPIVAGTSGQTVSISADSVTFDGDGLPPISAPGGTVSLAPVTAGRPVLLASTADPAALSIVVSDMAFFITADTLRLGSPAAGQIRLGVAGDTINFGTGTATVANTLDLRSGAGVVELATALVVGAVSGNAVSATLNAAGNAIGILGSFTTTGGLALTNGAGLTVTGPVTGGTSVLLNVNGNLAISGGINAATVGLLATGALTEPGGAITADLLGGAAASVSLTGANTISTIADLIAATGTIPGPFAFNDTQSVVVSGTASGDLSISTSGNLTINTGLIQSPGTVALTVGGAISEVSGGFISASVLTGSAASATLDQPNAISTLGPFATSAGFGFVNSRNLAVVGPVTDGTQVAVTNTGTLAIGGDIVAPTVLLTALAGKGGPPTGTIIQIAGNVAGSTEVALSATGAISQTGGTMTAGLLTGNSGGATTLTSAANAVVRLGTFTSGGDFALATSGDLALAGTLTAPNAALTAAATISQPSGLIATGTLSGTAGSANFASTGNTVATLGGFASGGDFLLADAAAVTVAGTVAAGTGRTLTLIDNAPTFGAAGLLDAPAGTVALSPLAAGNAIALGGGSGIGGNPPVIAHELIIGAANAGPITIGGALNLTQVDVLDLLSGGAIAESGAGAIAVPVLAGQGASATLNAAANAIGTLGSFTTTGGLALTNGAGLTVTGPVTDGASVNLNVTGGLAIAGGISAPTVGLIATGAITEPGGAITANSLSGSAASVDLTGPNAVATITNFVAATGTIPGSFAFNDTQSVVVSGTVSGDLSISTAGDLTINTGLIQSPGTVALTVGGAITEVSGGFISAGVLTGSAGSGTLDQPNFVTALGPFATGTGFAFVNLAPLTVAGPVSDGVRAAITSNGPLTVAGNVTAPTVLLTALPAFVSGPPDPTTGTITQTGGNVAGSTQVGLSATGAISQTGGTMTAGLLTGNSGGATTLTSAANAVVRLGDFTSGGDFALTTSGDLALAGTLTAPNATLAAAGAISQPAGLIATGTLTGAAGSASFASTGNTVATLGGFTSGGDFLLADAAAVTIAGTVTAGTGRTLTITDNAPAFGAAGLLDAPGGTVALSPLAAGNAIALGGGSGIGGSPPVIAHELIIGATNAGPITIGGAFNLTQVDLLDLLSAGAISESGAGAIAVPALAGQGASATLNAAANAISTLGSFTTTGGLALTNGAGLTVTGPVTDGVSVNLNVTGGLAIAGGISAPTVGLIATGAMTEPGGAITANSLSGSAASVDLTGPNAVATITNFVAATGTIPGPFAFNDTRSVVVSGTVSGDLSISTSGDLTINTGLIQSPGTVALTVGGAINEVSGGFISAGVLTGSAGSGTLEQPNSISTLGPFATGTLFNFVNFGNLAVSGPVTDGALVVVTNNGPLTIAGNITAPVERLTALPLKNNAPATGTINQTAGTVAGSANIVLSATGTIGQTGGVMVTGVLDGSSGGSTTLTSAANAVAHLGDFTSVGNFALATSGNLALTGTLTAPNVALTATGAISQPSGLIATGTLTGAGSSASFASTGNTVATLGGFAAGGDFLLADAAAVTVAGTVAAGTGRTLTLIDNAPAFGAAGLLDAPAGTVALSPLAAGNAIALGGGSGIDGSPPVIAHELIIGAANAGPITIGGAFNLTQVDVLDLLSGGAIAESGAGAIAVPVLAGQGASATLNAAANAIGTLGSFTTTGGLALTNGAGLTVAGPVTDGVSVNLNVTGGLAIAGGISAPTVGLIATGAITEPGGAITANSLSGSAASVDLTGPNAVATITNFVAATGATPGAFAFNDTQSVVVSGTVSGDLSISTSGDLTINTGLIQSPGTVALTVGGAIIEVSGGFISAGVLTGSAGSGTLDQPNFVTALGPFATGTGFDFVNSAPLTVTGPLSDGARAAITSNGPLTVAGNVTAPTVLLTALPAFVDGPPDPATGTITQTSGTIAGITRVALSATGTIGQAGGLITAGLLTGNSGGATTLSSAANAVAQLGDFASGGDFALATSGNVALTGTLTAPNATLTAAGAISQPSGLIATGTLTGAGGSASFASPGNTIVALGGFAAAGDFLLADAAPLTVAGTVATGAGRTLTIADNAPTFGATGLLAAPAGTVALAPLTSGTPITLGGGGGIGGSPPVIAHELVVGSVSSGPITIGGAFNLTSVDVLDLISAGAIGESGAGAIAVPVLTGQGASATLAAGNAIGTLASFATTGGFVLADTIGLTLQGTLSASSASIAAPGITLAGNSLLLGSGGVSFTVLPGASGLGTFGQTGTTTVTSLGGATTVSVSLPAAGGQIAFGNLAAPGSRLVLTTGAGVATGQINVGSLLVIGSTGASDLFGTVAGVGGSAAATISQIQPTIDPNYLLNNCVIESVSCGISQTLKQFPQFPNPKLFTWQEQNGMPELTAAAVAAMLTLPPVQVVRQPRDPDIELPNISNLDY